MEEMKHYPDPAKVREELVGKYPAKVAKKRTKSIVINDPETRPEVQANVRTVPGIITQRGCSYAGCKGVVLGPTRDIVNIVHGPIGCSFYAWLTRRNQTRPETPEHENYITYCFSTDMQEENVVFGGEKKLKQAIQEAYDLFHPKSIAIFSTCPVGLIGDDVHAASKEMREKFGDCNVFGFSCEGYRGVSQSAGHHIANNGVFKHMVGRNNTIKEGKFKLNLLGEYNIGGDAFEIERIFEKAGLTLVASFSGNSTVGQLENSHTADLNVIMCHRSINYMGEMMETKYGIPWMKVNFVGAESTAKSLRKIAEYFDDEELKARVEAVIAEEMPKVKAVIDEIRPRTEGKTAMLFVGGSRAHHYQDLFTELGMTTVAAGYEFAHRDDYEGRHVLPNIKIDADSKNIEELKVTADPELYQPRKTEAELEALKEKGLEINGYEGMMKQMMKKSLVIDDVSHYESEKLIEIYKPDIFCAGIKEKYVVQKMGVPLKQLHSYDYGGPYTGFVGATNFYRDIDRMVNNPVWKLIKAPWEKAGNAEGTELEAAYVTQ
ncbi:MAG: nitrogenase molybdenum-iron protein alpha chain [Chlorobium sp.]|uniref:nitrogenase molybdenum-iron protein alpha chain n=1 Tax=Chlorobium sp. TaxID=1095 RepID=UPI0025BD2E70|nr:nitrogenase molybdenum-iron protein alpha chain [Chlorobium sp.]MCF8216721.1 nitrogenase molybdenum-iron protein alpha chain [Chlorobium sp.]MCF8271604.1 nitrogenase molybdenum-iron protein alpha chain [Chlorobium sp.]MCF8287961.1 nitrogenase molybdenum-iron protein alpha chain [Chlorobium sp.]MCF8291521.1 nitrogenase molybdenum-iron protein alpha chain [Chlorobium sp.]MCF8385655.1 nitrogenase molybdenum-iron protein alpha chain [Chlorobium sp.]